MTTFEREFLPVSSADSRGKSFYHQLYGRRSPRTAFRRTDFADYMLMSLLCGVAVCLSYGTTHPIAILGMTLCLAAGVLFPVRHGAKLSLPLIVKRPQDVVFMVIHKVRNLRWIWFAALLLLLLENHLITLTPQWPHQVDWMRGIGLGLFYAHFAALTAYRTYVLYRHLRSEALIREVLMQTVWRRKLEQQPSVTVEVVHAYVTGMLSHILLIAPWFLVINHFEFSILFVPLALAINLFLEARQLKVLNSWFYRDHWLSHQSEFEFIYLHGTHHDAIPSGLIGVAGNGHLEGFLRHMLGAPRPFFHPLAAAMTYSLEIKGDIDSHQFIPGIFPKADIELQKHNQHSVHHLGRLEPYSFGMNVDLPGANPDFLAKLKFLPDEFKNSIRLDEELTGYQWHNEHHAKYLDLVMKYEPPGS